jgi:hypothetical protein
MKKLLSLLLVGLLPLCVYAQKPVDITSDCYLYGVDYSTIICQYDANGARIFRGFICRTSHSGERPAARNANNSTDVVKKNEANTSLTIVGKVVVSPNPTEGQANVLFENLPPKGSILYLTDTKGMLLHELAITDSNTTLSLDFMPAGVYILVVVCKGQMLWQTKLVKI